MKRVLTALFLLALTVTTSLPLSGAGPQKAKRVLPQILGETNKSALSYQAGEEMVYTFKASFDSVVPGKWFLQYVRKGDDGKYHWYIKFDIPAKEGE